MRTVRSSFRRYGIDRLLDGFKEGESSMNLSIENLAINCFSDIFPMNDWDWYVHRSGLRKEYFCGIHDICRWTLQRNLDNLGNHLEEVVDHLTWVMRVIRPNIRTNAYVDGSHIPRNSLKGIEMKYGEGRGTVQLQNQFMLASKIAIGILVAIKTYPGNLNYPLQFEDFLSRSSSCSNESPS